jgi:hypothetical protein
MAVQALLLMNGLEEVRAEPEGMTLTGSFAVSNR